MIKLSDGSVAQEISYDVWGNVLSDTNSDFQSFYYVGGLHDVDTKLIEFGVRSYDPEQAKLQAVALRLPLQLLFFAGR